MNKYWLVGIGGFVGSIARFWLGTYIGSRMGVRFPYGTVMINISGSFLIGLTVTLLSQRAHWNPNLSYLVPIGLVGGYTTFSTFELETFRSFHEGDIFFGLMNVILSVVLGFAAVWLGVVAGRNLG